MHISIVDNYELLSKSAAQVVLEVLKEKPDCVLGLPTGSTPVGMYEQLVKAYQEGNADFSKVTTFNLDEYIGLPQEHEQSYYAFMQQNLFRHINIEPQRTHIPRGDTRNVEEESKRYETEIDQAGGMDLLVIGIGTNGHIGFNEPGSDPHSRTRIIDLAPSTIQSNSRYFESMADVPKQAITMGLGTILSKSKRILLLASGLEKAEIMYQLLSNQEVSNSIPASFLKQHPDVTIVMDQAAAHKWAEINV